MKFREIKRKCGKCDIVEIGTKASEFQAFELNINDCGLILLDFYLFKIYLRLLFERDLWKFSLILIIYGTLIFYIFGLPKITEIPATMLIQAVKKFENNWEGIAKQVQIYCSWDEKCWILNLQQQKKWFSKVLIFLVDFYNKIKFGWTPMQKIYFKYFLKSQHLKFCRVEFIILARYLIGRKYFHGKVKSHPKVWSGSSLMPLLLDSWVA